MIPLWAVTIIAVIIVILLIASIFLLKRRKTKASSDTTLNKFANDVNDIERKTISSESNETVIASEKHHKQPQPKLIPQQSTITNASTVIASTVPTSPVPKLSKSNHLKANASTEGDADDLYDEIIMVNSGESELSRNQDDDEDDDFMNSVSPQEIIISLPLPPPSTSFFSDKMELENYAGGENGVGTAKEDLYALYSKLTNKDANSNSYKRNSFLQQKAATIKSTFLKQSLRLQSHKSTATVTTANQKGSLQNLFAPADVLKSVGAIDNSSNISSTTATVVGKDLKDDANYRLPVASTTTSVQQQTAMDDSAKVIIDMTPTTVRRTSSALTRQSSIAQAHTESKRQSSLRRSVDSNPLSVVAPAPAVVVAATPKSSVESGHQFQEEKQLSAAAAAINARQSAIHVIRSASIKARTRSMIIDKSKLSALGVSDDDLNRTNVLRQNSLTQFANTATPPIKKGEFMTITSGSVRRFVRDSVVTQETEPVVALTATREKLNNASRKPINVMEIAGYWDNGCNSINGNNRSSLSRQTSMQRQFQQQQPSQQNSRFSADETPATTNSNSSDQNQYYKASLSTSIFGTLSKGSINPVAAAYVLSDETAHDDSTSNNTHFGGLLARHGSLKRGATISRNTLKFIKNSATQGVNRSLKGLFDSSNNATEEPSMAAPSFSPKIDDSQKMELTPSESIAAMKDIQTIANEKVILPDEEEQQEQRKQQGQTVYHNRTHTQETDLSSNKLALGEGGSDNLPDESSKKTAIDDDEDQIDVMYASKDSSYYFGVTEEELESLAISTDTATKASIPQRPSFQNKYQSEQEKSESSLPLDDTTSHQRNSGVEVDDIRRMLQETWLKNMRESESSYSMLSEAPSAAATGNSHSGLMSPISPTISTYASAQQQPQSTNKFTSIRFSQQPPPQQQQSQLTKSLLTQQVAKRASLLAIGQQQVQAQQEYEEPQQPLHYEEPEPSASFSSSTVRTVVPENEQQQQQQQQQNGSNKVVADYFSPYNSYSISSRSSAQLRHQHMANIFSQQYDETLPSSVSSSPRNSVSAASTFSRATRSSSGNNSTATAIRLLPSVPVNNNNMTWNGRIGGSSRNSGMTHNGSYHQNNSYSSSRPSILQQRFDDDDGDNEEEGDIDARKTKKQARKEEEEESDKDQTFDASPHERPFFTTMKRGKKVRGSIPWMAITKPNNDGVHVSSSSSVDRSTN